MSAAMQHVVRALFVACCMVGKASAHDFHVGMSDVQFNPRSGNTEFVHVLSLHDLDAAMRVLHQRALDFSRKEDEALLQAYVEKTFFLETANKKRLPLRWVGISSDTQNLTIYQELTGQQLNSTNVMQHAMMMEVFADQTNNVNLRLKGQIKTLLFDRSLLRQSLR